jgi:hypothetical protein
VPKRGDICFLCIADGILMKSDPLTAELMNSPETTG